MKKVMVIGATGTIGQAICSELGRDCELIKVGNSSGEYTVDIASTDSIVNLYKKFNNIDAVICAAARDVVSPGLLLESVEKYRNRSISL